MLDNQLRGLFLNEIATQCRLGLFAFDEINAAADSINREALNAFHEGGYLDFDPEQTRITRKESHWKIWLNIQSFLGAAANASKILWPENPRKEKGESPDQWLIRCEAVQLRGSTLRNDVDILIDHELSDKSFRNTFEHYDERLESWARESDNRTVVDFNIGPLGAFGGTGTSLILRNYDPKSRILIFRGQFLRLNIFAGYLKDLESKAIAKESELLLNRHDEVPNPIT